MLNTASPLLSRRPELRRAVNYAVDRTPSPATIPAHMSPISPASFLPGFRDTNIYPLGGPDLAKARALASGNLRSGKATLYVADLRSPSLARS